MTAVTSFGLRLPLDEAVQRPVGGSRVTLAIRPENLAVGDHGLPVTLEHIEDMGNQKVLFCNAGGTEIRVVEPGDRAFSTGADLHLNLRNRRVVVLDAEETSASNRDATRQMRSPPPVSPAR